MVKMLLACASGISSNQFAQRLNETAKNKGVDINVEGCAMDLVPEKVGSFDVLLEGPVASHVASNLRNIIKDSASIVELSYADFNILNVDAMLEKGLAAANN